MVYIALHPFSEQAMKICIYGAGAVGGHFAVRFAQAGHAVAVIARGAMLDAIRRRGLTLVTTRGERISAPMDASDDPARIGPQDLVISTLKAPSLPDFARACAPLIGPNTQIVFAQNGIPWWYALGAIGPAPQPDLAFLDPEGRIAASVPHARCHGAVVTSGNTVTEPGVIDNSTATNTVLLAPILPAGNSDAAESLRALFTAAHLASPPVADLRIEIWRKLLMNIVTGSTVLTGEDTAISLTDADVRATAQRLADEVVAIGAAWGIPLRNKLPVTPPGKKASLLQDYEMGRAMEVDAQFKAPLAFARAAGIDVPVLETVTHLIAFQAQRLARRTA